ncbi:MAG: hypothetical protein ACRDLN_00605 [Solirubrobacteraceae bacterium]
MATGNTSLRALAWIELNMLNFADVLPLRGAVMEREPTDVYDLNGEPLFQRFPIDLPQGVGFVDVAADPRLGAPLVAVSASGEWSEGALLHQATAAFGARFPGKAFDSARFVAFSFPKIAVQFLSYGEEIALLELFTWEPVPPACQRPTGEPPANFDRWSFLDELDPGAARTRRSRFTKRVAELEPIIAELDGEGFSKIERRLLESRSGSPRPTARGRSRARLSSTTPIRSETREVRPSYEVRGQQTNVWCVPASVQMLLDFYHHEQEQTRIATELGLGTLSKPRPLPVLREAAVLGAIGDLTRNALNATTRPAPNWSYFRSQINANRPMISFILGHSRMVAGYTISNVYAISPFRGLLVLDPWPPRSGVVTRWENFVVPTHTRAYTAHVTPV